MTQKEIAKITEISRSGIQFTLRRYRNTSRIQERKAKDYRNSNHGQARPEQIRQESKSNIRKMTKELNIGRRSVHRIDSASAHKAKVVQQWCQANFPAMITSKEWPPYSPDLNPRDFSVWSVLESTACTKSHKNLDVLKRVLQKV
ncbi:hypothetical protein FHG87_005911 [Trinorchestia longiramus]|nr:hypothetical protein FHG87_005911 [Trinorchestia longiramus]